MNNDETRAHEYGEQAAMRGLTTDACPYRRHDLKAHWLRGYHAWKRAQADEPIEASAAGKAFLAALKAKLTGQP